MNAKNLKTDFEKEKTIADFLWSGEERTKKRIARALDFTPKECSDLLLIMIDAGIIKYRHKKYYDGFMHPRHYTLYSIVK